MDRNRQPVFSRRTVLSSLALAFGSGDAPPLWDPAANWDPYALVVGSRHYLQPPINRNLRGFEEISAADRTVESVTSVLTDLGARRILRIISTQTSAISKDDVFNGIKRVLSSIEVDRPANPIVIYYFIGHGVWNGLTWDHYSIPGNLVYNPARGELGSIVSNSMAIYTGDVLGALPWTKIPVLLLIDSCQEGSFRTPSKNFPWESNIYPATRMVFSSMTNSFFGVPVVLPGRPGTVSSTVDDPDDPTKDVGPLARRLSLSVRRIRQKGEVLSVGTIVAGLADPTLDDQTEASDVSHAGPWDGALAVPRPDRAFIRDARAKTVALHGTGSSLKVCCTTK